METEPHDAENASEKAPPSPERRALAEADRAFAVGNHARVRELVGPLVDHPDGSVARDAVALMTKVAPDPAQYIVLGLSLAFFLYIAGRYLL